jgi:hypothetical protein
VADDEAAARDLAQRLQRLDGRGDHAAGCCCVGCENAVTTAIADALRAHGRATAEAMREAAAVAVEDYMASDYLQDGGPQAAVRAVALPASPPSDPRPEAKPDPDRCTACGCALIPCREIGGKECVNCRRVILTRRSQPDPRPGAETFPGGSPLDTQCCHVENGRMCVLPRYHDLATRPAAPQAEPRDEGTDDCATCGHGAYIHTIGGECLAGDGDPHPDDRCDCDGYAAPAPRPAPEPTQGAAGTDVAPGWEQKVAEEAAAPPPRSAMEVGPCLPIAGGCGNNPCTCGYVQGNTKPRRVCPECKHAHLLGPTGVVVCGGETTGCYCVRG